MKIIQAVVRRFAPLSLVLVALPAAGGGGTGSQGPRFLGKGLDEPVQVSGAAYYTPSLQEFPRLSPSFPPVTDADINQAGATVFKLKELKCKKIPAVAPNPPNTLLASCEAYVKSTIPGPVCRVPNPMVNKVQLIALDAKWNPANGSFILGGSNSVIFACRDLSPGAVDLQDRIGAIGKCAGEGFFNNPSPSMQKEFAACIRAMRADYCGTGLSFTLPGTPFAVYDWDPATNMRVPEPHPKPVCVGGQCFEASWKEDGANCINHARYEQLLRLSGNEHFSEGALRGPPKQYNRQCAGSDSLAPCGMSYDPVGSCVAQYTDFYFNDQYQIAGAGGFNPVAAVTAQFVCRTGEIRRNGVVRTRTMVRFIPNGATTPVTFPCCDTLPCP